MKTKKLVKKINLNKKTISNLELESIRGGCGDTISCWGFPWTCGTCLSGCIYINCDYR